MDGNIYRAVIDSIEEAIHMCDEDGLFYSCEEIEQIKEKYYQEGFDDCGKVVETWGGKAI